MKTCFFSLILCLLTLFAKTQIPTTSDCLGAIPVCRNLYIEPTPYSHRGNGNYNDEILKFRDCYTPESNGVWYILTVQSAGALRFSITPHDSILTYPGDSVSDYDWIFFDLTNGNCEDLQKNPENFVVSSNNFGSRKSDGRTGADSRKSGGIAGNCNGPGDYNGPAWNDDINVAEGNTYVLYVSNFDTSQFGYNIDFSASTAKIFDNIGPTLQEIKTDSIKCGGREFEVYFSENVDCQSVSPQDFSITDQSSNTYLILSVQSKVCALGGKYSKNFTIRLEKPISQGGTYSISLIGNVTDACANAARQKNVHFDIETVEIQNISKVNAKCEGSNSGTIYIESANNEHYSYSIDGGKTYFPNKNYFDNLPAGNYDIRVKNYVSGCETDGGIINIKNEGNFAVTSVQKQNVDGCFGDKTGEISVQVTGNHGKVKFSIDNGNSFLENNGIFENLAAGNYQIEIRDTLNCKLKTEPINIEEPKLLTLSLEKTDLICEDLTIGKIEIHASGGTGMLLFQLNGENIQDSVLRELKTGKYVISVNDEKNCLTKDSVDLVVENAPCLSIPNAFTPNNDGKNDKWVILGIETYPQIKIFVYDRYSNLVFKSEKNKTEWDGTNNGKPLPTDSYFYVIDFAGEYKSILGYVTLVR